ncbi:PhnB protein [Paraburkholderia eburnea]|uniref:PhnB protein n=2 Tax=Paraburkholderia eburnea TaxID=1189126 RepID=A0A2S4MLV9_9BURK|nr:VOC family protein [Paraburkholderia eburnea]POR55730.1 PhnB protein [Paraburkholderia eburnea]PRZ26858.1 PhnB protein [Paraburkholderia eburnea]
MQIQPYLFYNGTCEEAIAFYREALGATELFKMRFKEGPPDPQRPLPPELADKIMHATIQVGDAQLMMSDGGCMTHHDTFTGFSVSLTAPDAATAQRYFDALSSGAQIGMPFQKTFWSPGFGMLTDKFGVPWMVTAPPLENPSP